MQQEAEVFYSPTLQDISLDEHGQVVVNDPLLNKELEAAAAAKAKPKPPPSNGVCPVFNTVKGCGTKSAQ